MHRRDRAGVRRADERAGQEAGHDQQQFRQQQRLAGRGAHLCHRPRPGDARPGDDREPPQAVQAILRAAELHLGQDAGLGPGDHPGQPQPDPRQGRRRRRAEDRPHQRGGLRLHRLGRAERAPADRGRRRPAELGRARAGIGAADGMGLQRLARPSRCSRRAPRSPPPRSSSATAATCRWSRRATLR